jgi:hypothetical protein
MSAQLCFGKPAEEMQFCDALTGRYDLLLLVFAFAQSLQDGEAGFFGVADREWLKFQWAVERGNDFANRLFARGTGFELRGIDGPAQSEFATADHAISVAKFVFVIGHFPRIP